MKYLSEYRDPVLARSLVDRILAGPPRAIADAAPDEPAELVAICDKALQREPGDRYPSITELAADLRRYLGRQERVHIPLKVAAVAPERAFPRDGAFVSVQLLEALEDYRDGRAVLELGWDGSPSHGERTYSGLRPSPLRGRRQTAALFCDTRRALVSH